MRKFPWWGSVILAIGAYNGLKYGVPKLMVISGSTAEFLGLLAPLCAMAFLLLAAKQLYDGTEKQEPDERDGDSDSEQ